MENQNQLNQLKKTSNCTISIKIMGKTWKREGTTIKSTLDKFDLGWEVVKGKGIMIVTEGEKRHEHLFTIFELRRIFANKITRMIWAKRLTLLME